MESPKLGAAGRAGRELELASRARRFQEVGEVGRRLVEGQEDTLDLASRLSSLLLELCEVEVFLLSWPGPSQLSSPRTSTGKYSSGHCRSCHRHWKASLVIGCDVNK